MRYLAVLLASFMLISCQSVTSPTVTVTGSAVVEAVPDTVFFDLTASYVGDTADEARSVASGLIGHSLTLLESYGVASDDVRTAYFSISPYYEYSDGTRMLVGQSAVESVSVTFHDTECLGDVLEALSSMDGIEISGIRLDKTDKSLERIKARELAVQDAYSRATVYATAAGYMLGDLISISSAESYGLEEARVYSMAPESGTSYYPGTIEVRDDVSAVFSLSE